MLTTLFLFTTFLLFVVWRERFYDPYLHHHTRLTHTDWHKYGNTYNRFGETHSGVPSIFVSVASYRDRHCANTLQELFKHATLPHRVYVGVYQQNEESDQDCLDGVDAAWAATNVKVHRVHAKEAAGPCIARFHAANMYANQDFFAQFDSHLWFLPDWDEKLIQMYNESTQVAKTHKVVLSSYPLAYDVDKQQHARDVHTACLVSCKGGFDPNLGFLVPTASAVPCHLPPREHAWAAAGVMFGLGSMLHDVPHDPTLRNLFQGEEMLYSMRLWAAGYKIYSMNQNICTHFYTRSEDAKPWVDHSNWYIINQKTVARVKRSLLLDFSFGPKLDPKYSLTENQVRAFYQKWGLDPQKKTVQDFC